MTIQEQADAILARGNASGCDELLVRLAHDRDALLKALKDLTRAVEWAAAAGGRQYDAAFTRVAAANSAIAQAERPR